MRTPYNSGRRGWGDENVVQDRKERMGREECCAGARGKGWEMRMLYKSGRRGWGDENVAQEW
jgi:hypothetical protein